MDQERKRDLDKEEEKRIRKKEERSRVSPEDKKKRMDPIEDMGYNSWMPFHLATSLTPPLPIVP